MKQIRSVVAVVMSLGCGSAFAQGTLEDFAVLAGAAVTCTVSSVQGDVGLANAGAITNTSCAISGSMQAGTEAAQTAYATFLDDYARLAAEPPCDPNNVNVPLAGAFLPPGVYCYDAAVTVTDGTLTLQGSGSADDTWIFRIGTGGTGALTGTGFNVVMTGGGTTCSNNVLWWTAQAATLKDSTFIGSILAGADITVTRGSLAGQVLAGGTGTTTPNGAVTLTGTVIDFCTAGTPPPGPPLLPVFVIGDVEPHAVGDSVNFWGAQWWKNNIMSGIVKPGASRASFKGFATRAQLECGGSWESRPGNSAPPPATIAADIAVVVTSTVQKIGPNIGGDIKEIIVVSQDGGYGPNPGHAGNGLVKSIVCTQ